MKALILAAGRGSRMAGLTAGRPKCLVEFRGRALLDWQIAALREGGASEIGIVTGYRRELLSDRGLREFFNPRWAETNMVSSLARAREWLAREPCLVSYSDIVYSAAGPIALAASTAEIAISYDADWRRQWELRFDDPLCDAETFRIGTDGRLCEIGGRPRTIEEVEGQYMGLLRFAPAGWAEVERIRAELDPAACDRIDMTSTLARVIEAGRIAIAAIRYRGVWAELDTENDVRVLGSTGWFDATGPDAAGGAER